jgi:poly(3-hydroxybutyrate) depolymerase
VTISSKSVIGTTTDRLYILHLPSTYQASNNKAAPLVLAFHGQQQHAWSMEAITELSNPDFNPNTIVAYPEGVDFQAPGVSSYYQYGPSRRATKQVKLTVRCRCNG